MVAIVATGHTAPLLLAELRTVNHYDQHLTLDGLRLVFERNRDTQRGRLKTRTLTARALVESAYHGGGAAGIAPQRWPDAVRAGSMPRRRGASSSFKLARRDICRPGSRRRHPRAVPDSQGQARSAVGRRAMIPIRSPSNAPTLWRRSVPPTPTWRPTRRPTTSSGVAGRVIFARNSGKFASPHSKTATAPICR